MLEVKSNTKKNHGLRNITKAVLLFFSIMFFGVSFSQSKKEQIEELNTRIDSLNQVLQSERTFNSDKIKGINSTVIKLESEISNLKNSLKSLNYDFEKQKGLLDLTNLELSAKREGILAIQNELKIKADSLKFLRSELEKYKPKELVKQNNTTIQERQVQNYKSVKIGTQTWMTENLNIDKFRNGEAIPQAKNKEEWERAKINKLPIWAYYDYNPANAKYGKLYNWYAVNDPRGFAPTGWHVPNNLEWQTLTDYLNKFEAGKKIKKHKWLG
jgi:hypothetical protein